MARTHPAGWRQLTATGSAERELQTLAQLAAGLSDRYAVYHGVHWTRSSTQRSIFGEIDFVVVGPGRKILLIEQKSGFLTEEADGLCKPYPGKAKNVPLQMVRNAQNFRRRLAGSLPDVRYEVESLLYCPDYRVKNPGTAGIDPQRIVDAGSAEGLVGRIHAILPENAEHKPDPSLHRFLADLLDLVPDVTAMIGEADALSTRLSGGLAHWARRIRCHPQRIRVRGTAGCGKTQLALAVFRDAVTVGRRPLYVCYNRPLAEHFRAIAPEGGEVLTYHQLADRVCRGTGAVPDFSAPDSFRVIEEHLDRWHPSEAQRFDVLIVDEGQDFSQGWADNLLRALNPDGSAWWLEDPLQNLYGRDPVGLPGWVELQASTNYRSPQDIVAALQTLLSDDLDAGCPIAESGVEIISYDGPEDLTTKTVGAITRAVGLGFRREHIAVVTYRGRERSALSTRTRIGPYPLIAPTGRYDLFGNPVLTTGDVVIDSVHRFKGRAAPCIVFTEIDFEIPDAAAIRRLFVGCTRATMKLLLIVSQRSRPTLEGLLSPYPEDA